MCGWRSIILFTLFISVLTSISAQNRKAERFFEKAEEAKTTLKFEEAKENYLKAAAADQDWSKPYQELGILAFKLRQDSVSIQYLEQALERPLGSDPRVHHMLGELYMRNALYVEAADHWQAFLDANTQYENLKQEARQQLKRSREILTMKEDPAATNIQLLPATINTKAHEYLPVLPADMSFIIFTRRYSKEGVAYTQEDYFISHRKDSAWTEAQPIDEINTNEPEGGATLSADGQTMILVRCEDRKGFGSCDLYISFLRDNKWSNPMNLGDKINTAYKERQPSFSADGNRIYFSSNRPGGYGGMDIWYIDWLPEGKWSDTRVMDTTVNSKYNERAPFMHYDNQTLYFTSDRPESLGESDLFMTRRQGEKWKPAERLGWPINSPGEEGTMYVSIDGKTGFMGRINRDDQSGYDIYTFELGEEAAAIPSIYVHGKVVDAETGYTLSAQLEVLEKESGNRIAFLKTNTHGKFLFAIPKDKEYQFFVDAEGYRYYSRQFNYDDFEKRGDGLYTEIELHPLDDTLRADTSPVVLENIFFETGSARLKDASRAELEHLHDLLQKRPDMKIEIRGHTDDVGSAQANQILSMQRAKAVHDYLVEKGIDADRLKYKGFGESLPRVPNDSPENRQRNRRVEFVLSS